MIRKTESGWLNRICNWTPKREREKRPSNKTVNGGRRVRAGGPVGYAIGPPKERGKRDRPIRQ